MKTYKLILESEVDNEYLCCAVQGFSSLWADFVHKHCPKLELPSCLGLFGVLLDIYSHREVKSVEDVQIRKAVIRDLRWGRVEERTLEWFESIVEKVVGVSLKGKEAQ